MSKTSDEEHSWMHIDFNELEVGKQIGGGGVGVIYKGWFGREEVALKTLFDARISPEVQKEYMDELLVMSKVKHSNIVKFIGACMKPPNLCFVMELCESSLHNILHVQQTTFPIMENIQMAIDVASAMEYLHSLHPAIIHRDLKSLNILKAYNGCLKVCDFGLVKVRNTTAGTPAYMAPELLENKPYNKSVDVFAFALVFWEILCGEIPYRGQSLQEIRDKCLGNNRPHLPYSMNARCATLLKNCWHQSSESRPSFSRVVDELVEIEASLPSGGLVQNSKDNFGDALDDMISHK